MGLGSLYQRNPLQGRRSGLIQLDIYLGGLEGGQLSLGAGDERRGIGCHSFEAVAFLVFTSEARTLVVQGRRAADGVGRVVVLERRQPEVGLGHEAICLG